MDENAGDQVALLLFRLGVEWYAVRVGDVREIYQEYEVTPVPCVPEFIQGVVNIRGEILSVTDLAKIMGLGSAMAEGVQPPAIVVNNQEVATAMVVDEIGDIIELPQGGIEAPVSIIDRTQAEFVSGSVYVDGTLVGVVNVDRVSGARRRVEPALDGTGKGARDHGHPEADIEQLHQPSDLLDGAHPDRLPDHPVHRHLARSSATRSPDQVRPCSDFLLLGGLSLVLLVSWGFILYYLGRRFVSPLNAVVESVRSACQGEIGRKVDVKGEDEIGVLAQSYNQMLDLIIYLIRQTQESSKRLSAVRQRHPLRYRAAGLRLRRAGRVDQPDHRDDGGARLHLSPDRREREPGRVDGGGLARQRRRTASRRS